jgi:hypothetical protein
MNNTRCSYDPMEGEWVVSLSKRLKQLQTQPQLGPSECRTCAWLATQPKDVVQAFWECVDSGVSRTQLRKECAPDGLEVSESAFNRHLKNPKCRERLNPAGVKRIAS